MHPAILHARRLGLQPYVPVWRAMQLQLCERGPATPDAIWRVEHPPVFTLGRNARAEHLLTPGAIPVVRIDRGGQVTFHGPGQVVLYLLLELRRHRLGVRSLVDLLQEAVVATLGSFGVAAYGRPDAPGVYVEGAKIAALGLRIRGGCSMHGVALNVVPRLEMFRQMNPCGHPGLASTSLHALGQRVDPDRVASVLEAEVAARLGCVREPVPALPGELVRIFARPIR
ncbi:Octanoate-[acyl-carrier-protein]-protein-N-octan oyltransferase [Thioalkalivibrio nitratireducens DSM 14787]|uniref:Octanoyltransferase n=1 Tax=Thioalkalivibrio nitratireducens (strain DSM 14787 / UNIQEM 213 / ALEN2) TaxID=1255043 RepID=L0DXT3_THIND|nr:lipoyl(octanoyl) transferase LipB [Thioalkalivibrio nitratireducens]AGA33853.1 Octanoate-[acyl-carrier-protein]-protein-N-octan oyltransferase [Thioalkalivibrio nitratireducens DSM 14787]